MHAKQFPALLLIALKSNLNLVHHAGLASMGLAPAVIMQPNIIRRIKPFSLISTDLPA